MFSSSFADAITGVEKDARGEKKQKTVIFLHLEVRKTSNEKFIQQKNQKKKFLHAFQNISQLSRLMKWPLLEGGERVVRNIF